MTTIFRLADNARMLRHNRTLRKTKSRVPADAVAAVTLAAGQVGSNMRCRRLYTTGERPPSTLVAVPVM